MQSNTFLTFALRQRHIATLIDSTVQTMFFFLFYSFILIFYFLAFRNLEQIMFRNITHVASLKRKREREGEGNKEDRRNPTTADLKKYSFKKNIASSRSFDPASWYIYISELLLTGVSVNFLEKLGTDTPLPAPSNWTTNRFFMHKN